MSMEERILAKATELIDQRVAEIMDAASSPRIRRLDDYLMIEAKAREVGDPEQIPWSYAGQLQLSDNRVFVVPFVVETYEDSYWADGVFEEPQINGRSIFSVNRPSLSKKSEGAAVYLQKSWKLYVSSPENPFSVRARFVSCQIIQQSLLAPYPRDVGEVDWPYDATKGSDVEVTKSECSSSTLLGVYTKDGAIYPGYIFGKDKVTSFTDPLADESPHLLPSSVLAPFTRSVRLINP